MTYWSNNYTLKNIMVSPNTSLHAWCTVRPNTLKHQFGAEKGLLQGHARGQVARTPKTLNSLKGFSKAFVKARWGRSVVFCCRFLGVGILCPCSCPHRSGHHVPVNLQQGKCYSLFCSFLSLYEWKSVNTLKGQSLEDGLSCIFQAIGNILNSKQKQ